MIDRPIDHLVSNGKRYLICNSMNRKDFSLRSTKINIFINWIKSVTILMFCIN